MNRLIFQLDMQWVAPLLGINANALDIFLCIVSLESAISCVLCISFPPVCLTPKTTALNEQVSGGCWKHWQLLSFLLLYIVWHRMEDFFVKFLKSWIFKTANKFYKLVCRTASVVGGANVLLLLTIAKQMSFSPSAFTRGCQVSSIWIVCHSS